MEEEKNNNLYNFNDLSLIGQNRKLKICCLTWNMHGLLPNDKQIQELLNPHKNYDIYAIGSEECLRSIFKSFFLCDKTEWEERLVKYFGGKYRIIATSTLCAIHLAIFVRTSLIKNVSNLKMNCVKTGANNLLGNKGAVGISFQIFNLSISIINCHLSARYAKSEKRNLDFERCATQMHSNSESNNIDLIIWILI